MRQHLIRKFEAFARKVFWAGQTDLVAGNIDHQIAFIWFA